MGTGILLVDDALFMRRMLRGILEEAGYEIAGEAENGEQALELVRELRPELVTLDIVMPGLSGLDVLDRLMACEPQPRVVMCSAMGQEALVERALSAGARDFILKPFQPGRVLEVVAAALGR